MFLNVQVQKKEGMIHLVKGANGKDKINTFDVKCDEYLEDDGSNNVERLKKIFNEMKINIALRCGKKWKLITRL